MSFYCSNVPSKMFYGSIGAEFPLEFLEQPPKLKIFLVLVNSCQKRMLKQNGQMRRIRFFFLIKMIQRQQEVCIEYNKLIEEVMQAIGF